MPYRLRSERTEATIMRPLQCGFQAVKGRHGCFEVAGAVGPPECVRSRVCSPAGTCRPDRHVTEPDRRSEGAVDTLAVLAAGAGRRVDSGLDGKRHDRRAGSNGSRRWASSQERLQSKGTKRRTSTSLALGSCQTAAKRLRMAGRRDDDGVRPVRAHRHWSG